MKIIIDRDIPYIKGVFEPYAVVEYLVGSDINRKALTDADALIIRTRTKCNADLLESSSVKIISSATIGSDHVDLEYCTRRGVAFHNAAGCNASAVMQYVFTTLYLFAKQNNYSLKDKYIGVVGVGNVGSRVACLAEYLGFKVLLNDPPRARKEGSAGFTPLERLLEQSDIITTHVPLDNTTESMIDDRFLSAMKKGSLLINTSRGEVADEAALISFRDKFKGFIIDVWRDEPDINKELLRTADIATPHIAGYSFEGKLRATMMVVRQIASYFNIEELLSFEPEDLLRLNRNKIILSLKSLEQNEIAYVLNELFPVIQLDRELRYHPENFEEIRVNYKLRREFHVE